MRVALGVFFPAHVSIRFPLLIKYRTKTGLLVTYPFNDYTALDFVIITHPKLVVRGPTLMIPSRYSSNNYAKVYKAEFAPGNYLVRVREKDIHIIPPSQRIRKPLAKIIFTRQEGSCPNTPTPILEDKVMLFCRESRGKYNTTSYVLYAYPIT